MRKVVYGGACSLDGFLAGPAGEIDWLHFSRDVAAEMQARWATVDTMIFGRKTWEEAVARSGGTGGGSMPGVSAYVCSRTLTSVPEDGPTLVQGDAADFVRDLKAAPGKDIVLMSGGNLARSLFAADLIDEVGFNVHPLLLGAGVPALLDAGRRVPLDLTQCRQMDGGCVLLLYTVRHGAAKAATGGPAAAPSRRAGR
jgi:dihydrofolate reductase